MKKKKFTYQKSGVNINAADSFVKFISRISSKNKGQKKFNNIGGFGSISHIPRNLKPFVYYTVFLEIKLIWRKNFNI